MSGLKSIRIRRIAGLGVLVMALALVGVLMAGEASAKKPSTSTSYTIVLKIGNMATSTFVADGNQKGNKIHDHTATVTLRMGALYDSKDHSSFGVCGSPSDPDRIVNPDPLDSSSPPIVWGLGGNGIQVSRNEIGMFFGLNFVDACGFDDYTFRVEMSITGGTGAGTYTDPEAFVYAQHYAETENLDRPPGPRRISHTDNCCATPFFATNTPITITITAN